MKIKAYGIGADLPRGWEGTISSERRELVEAQASAFGVPDRLPEVLPVAHFATFGMPATRSDFGAAAVDQMSDDDVFVSLLEYDPAEANTALFAHQGLPRRLDPRAFSPRMLQRTIPGQSGFQLFFTHQGRAFCLYVVLGNAGDAHRLVRRAEQVLATLQIEERP